VTNHEHEQVGWMLCKLFNYFGGKSVQILSGSGLDPYIEALIREDAL
jgi:hypothetical protein